jgi:hypothetical protein
MRSTMMRIIYVTLAVTILPSPQSLAQLSSGNDPIRVVLA